MFALPELPYAQEALEPTMSQRTLHYHHDKHHAAYVKTLNDLLTASIGSESTLESVIVEASRSGDSKLFNCAAQAWNHSFFWVAMSPRVERPAGAVALAIERAFGDLNGLKDAFVSEGVAHFGSGWVWLTADGGGLLRVRATHDADDTLMQAGVTPLLVCDLWEHAYYLDRQNDRKGYLEAWFDSLPNWEFAARQYVAALGQGDAWLHPLPHAHTEFDRVQA